MKNRLLSVVFALAASVPVLAQGPADSLGSKVDYPVLDYTKPGRYVIDDVTVTGVYILDPRAQAESVGIYVGDTITVPGPYLSSAIKLLVTKEGYADADISLEPIGGDRVRLNIYLQATPRVSEWRFEGISKGQATTLKDKEHMNLAGRIGNAATLTDYDITKHSNYIKEHYKEKGFRNTKVEVKTQPDTKYPGANLVIVTFVIDRGDRVKIGRINFNGNEAFSDKRLRRTLKGTHQRSINIFQGAKLKDKKYEEDKAVNLIDFYNSKGYRNATVLRDSVYYITPNRLGIDIDMFEGNEYYYRNVRFIGNTVYPTESGPGAIGLAQLLGIEKGQLYDKKALDKRLGIGNDPGVADDPTAIATMYKNSGYLRFDIEPTENVIGKDSIDLEIKIFEGRPHTINKVNIAGNSAIDDEVIRREIYAQPGELYSQQLLMETMRRLGATGHFDQTTLFPGIMPVGDRTVDLSWDLTEVPNDQVEVSGGWGAGSFIGSVRLHLKNLSTRRIFQKGAEWRPYPRGQNQVLSLSAQSNGQSYKAFSINFLEPWMGGKKPIQLNVGTHYSDQTTAYYAWQKSSEHFRTLGVSVGIGKRLMWPDPSFQLYHEFSYMSYILDNWDEGFIMSNGRSNIFALTTVLSRSSLNGWPVFPESGSKFSLSLALTPPYSLFDKKDYADASMSEQERYKFIEYHKWKFSWEWYTPLSSNNKLILKTAMELGYLGHYNKNKVSPFEGFDMGGSGMSNWNMYGVDIIGLRGYEDGAITPVPERRGDYARVYDKFTAELRYPVIMQPTTKIFGLAFAEGGNAFRTWKEFNPFQLKRSLGVGVRIELPMVGMLGFDWGYGFDFPAGGTKRNGGQITFTFGNQF